MVYRRVGKNKTVRRPNEETTKRRWRHEREIKKGGFAKGSRGMEITLKKWRKERLTEENNKTTWKIERRQTIDEIGDISCLCDWWRRGKRKRFVGRREKRRRAEKLQEGENERKGLTMEGAKRRMWMKVCKGRIEEKRGERDGRIHVIENGWGYSVTAVTVSVFPLFMRWMS